MQSRRTPGEEAMARGHLRFDTPGSGRVRRARHGPFAASHHGPCPGLRTRRPGARPL